MKRLLAAVSLIFAFCTAHGELFKDGETVCFFGDSITHGHRYHRFIYDYYLTRFPDRTIHFVNAGVSGDSAGGAQGRLTEDVSDKKPAAVAIMFGMNDVGRGNYVPEPTARQLEAQRRSLDGYQKNMEKVVSRLRGEAGNPQLYFLTPSPFDETAVNDRNNNQPGCNGALGKCADMVRALAAKNGGQLVDFYGPMTAFNLEQQKTDPHYTITGPDRVHPREPGNLMMAWLFLKAQGAPALVSKVAVDARKKAAAVSDNAAVSGVAADGGVLTFTVLEKALPFPVDPAARCMLTLLPIERDLNQEILSVTGLAPGAYELTIDGAAAGRFSADALAAGVNLAFNAATPQARQAQKVAQLDEKRRSTECVLRNYAAVRWFLKHRRVDPDDLAAVAAFAETKMNKKGYYESQVPGYIKNWPARGEVRAKVTALEQELFRARQPVPHAYRVQAAP